MTAGKKKKKAIVKATEAEINKLVDEFTSDLQPVENPLSLFTDNRTGARYAECHVRGSKLVEFSTTDVPLDPVPHRRTRARLDGRIVRHARRGWRQADAC